MLDDLVGGARAVLGDEDNFCGAYLQGSFARGDADGHSDVDFLVVVQHEVTPGQEARLRALHERFPDSGVGWAQHLGGLLRPPGRTAAGRRPARRGSTWTTAAR